MEEFESQTERVEEQLHEHAHHSGEKWVSGVALTAALLAAFAATAAMLSGHHVNEAMIDRMAASDQWAHYQAKSIKSLTVQRSAGNPVSPPDRETIDRYERDQKQLFAEAKEDEEGSRLHLQRHNTLSVAVTLFQVAIAVSAISALTRKRAFWFVGIALGAAGVVFLVLGVLPGGTHAATEHVGEAAPASHTANAE